MKKILVRLGQIRPMGHREEMTGIVAASHNEITRLLAEHGVFGIIAFLILLDILTVEYS